MTRPWFRLFSTMKDPLRHFTEQEKKELKKKIDYNSRRLYAFGSTVIGGGMGLTLVKLFDLVIYDLSE